MYVNASPFDGLPPIAGLSRQRAVGRVAFAAAAFDGRTRPARISESGSMRIRLPNGAGTGLEAVLVNTAGGIACGDSFQVEIDAGIGTSVTVATPAAEKVYRSDGPVAQLVVGLRVGASARMDWLPQETLLFDRARLKRRLDVEMDEDARVTLFEAVVFGRAARLEQVETGFFEDRWRIRRGRRLAYADTLRLDGAIAALLRKPTVADGARVFATLLHVAPDSEARLESVRQHLASSQSCDAAASAWNGLLAVRFCAASIEALRAAVCPFLIAFRGEALPRVWLS
ncbi:urease accessory protein [Microvirga subterranea]|uniref:Urease accessory protein UreD n=2 Tax=Microvirga subterranea TaxID=186651 RepID=A0A370HQI0_9HYPH|nr:urease accessory protein [Microvirga subterranea]